MSSSKTRGWLLALGLILAGVWGVLRSSDNETAESQIGDRPTGQGRELASVEVPAPVGIVRRDATLMGSLFSIAVEADTNTARALLSSVVERLRGLEDQLSSWRQGSEIRRLNAAAGVEPVEISSNTAEILELAQRFHAETDGAFDITIGPVWDLWPFRSGGGSELPDSDDVEDALKLVDAGQIEIERGGGRITAYLPRAGMRVNLGAIGKGYAARVAAELLGKSGVESVAISAGGDVYTRGFKRSGPWIVEIENPRWAGRYLERFGLADMGLATSGDYRRKVEIDGKLYGHILDPRTGKPAAGVQSVSILSGDPVAADAYATAVSVMGPQKGMAWVEKHEGVEALIVDDGGVVRKSSGWTAATRLASRRWRRAIRPELDADDDERGVAGLSNFRRLPSGVEVRAGRLTSTSSDDVNSPASADENRRRSTPEINEVAGVPNRDAGRMVSVAGGQARRAGGEAFFLPLFFVDQTEVSNRAYGVFLDGVNGSVGHSNCHPQEPPEKNHTPRYWGDDWRPQLIARRVEGGLAPFRGDTFSDPERPVVGVDWWDVYAFSRWAGKRLPRRQEWEKAAAGRSGRRWPWGNEWRYGLANGGGEMNGERDGYTYSAPVTAFGNGASEYGALNMAGNVAEWTQEGFVMGGSSRGNPSQLATSAGVLRDPGFRSFDLGFRAAAQW